MSTPELNTQLRTDAGLDLQAVIDLTRASDLPKALTPNAPIGVIVPPGCTFVQPDLSAWLERPARKKGLYRPATVEAFTDYVTYHADVDHTSVWIHPTSGRVEAVLDDNAPGYSGWGQHRAVLQLEHTPEWKFWMAQDGKLLGQEEFAEHIEAGGMEIVEPDAATMLEIAQSFHATTSAIFKSQKRLATGEVQLQYEETIAASAGAMKQLDLPSMIHLVISPFVGEDARTVAARFRYRTGGGKLLLGYQIDRPHVVIRDALDKVTETLSAAFPNAYVGEPAA